MKKRARTMACGLHAFRWLACVSLVLLLGGACKPRDAVCMTGPVFQVLKPEERAGAAPFSIERLGSEVKSTDLETLAGAIRLHPDNHGTASWRLFGHLYVDTDFIFSPAEGVARDVDPPGEANPMRRIPGWFSDRVRFGFRSSTCLIPGKGVATCEQSDEELYLVAEMTCHSE